MKRYLGLQRVVVALVSAALAMSANANLLVNFTTVQSTNFAMFGYGGMRGIGTGTITVAGVSGTVTRAVLVWHGPTNSANPAANANVTFNGTGITGTNIGLSSPNCWSFQNSQAYQADVTPLVPGNGSYSLTNFVNANADINGASLLLFFSGVAANNRDIVVFLGNDSNIANTFDPAGWQATLNGINYSSGTAALRLIVSDGQTFLDNGLAFNGTVILPPGPNWQGNTVPNGASAASTNGGLWDQTAYDVTARLTPGVNNVTLTDSGSSADCLSLISVIFDLPVGAAPPSGPPVPLLVPTLSGWVVFLLALIMGTIGLLQTRRFRR
jgi:IPTL-CTERM motif